MAAFRQNTSSTKIILLIVVLTLIFVLGFVIGYFTGPGSDDDSAVDDSCKHYGQRRRSQQTKKEAFHKQLYDSLNAKEIGKNLKYFSKRPHVAGTAQSKVLANEIERRWREYGFDEVEQPKYNILLPYVSPNVSNKVQILSENNTEEWQFSGKEKLADPSENDTTMIPPLLGYAKPGDAKGTLLYVNYGRTEDFDVLKNNFGIPDCNGKIVIMRYGRIFRGDKVKNAESCSAAGVILYNDPADFAPFGENQTYPNGVWLPGTGVQRGSIYTKRGDPLTPGLPSIDGISRVPQETVNLPDIPATPMPYGEAINILRIMKGHEVPDSWRGMLPITYKLGNEGLEDNKTIRIEVNVPNKRQDVYNVIGTIYGKEEPDRWVLIGNHRDAWGFGAVDASSGTAVMMEISRGLGNLLKSGWRPRRTIKFCSWAAEEQGLIGSTEWVEQNERALSAKAVMYINIDIAVAGNYSMGLRGSPLLEAAVFDQAKKIDDPHVKGNGERKTMYERMLETSASKSQPKYGILAAASDYAAFYQFIGVPSIDMRYDFANVIFYPVYHSVHDKYKWLQGLIDPNFLYHLSTAQLASRLLMNGADAFVLQFDASNYGQALDEYLKLLRHNYGKEFEENNATLSFIEQAIQSFQKQAETFEKERDDALDSKSDLELRDINDRMVNVEKAFIYPLGLPNQPYTRHIVFAPSLNNRYGTTSFPGISDLMENSNKTTQDWEKIKQQVSVVFKAICEATDALKSEKQ